MSAATVDLNINEGETWNMSISLWVNRDKNEAMDISGWQWLGAFKIGTNYIPMSFDVLENEVHAHIAYGLLEDLQSTFGDYDIEVVNAEGEKYRMVQGRIAVNHEITTHGA